jgi:hypothetical protein
MEVLEYVVMPAVRRRDDPAHRFEHAQCFLASRQELVQVLYLRDRKKSWHLPASVRSEFRPEVS